MKKVFFLVFLATSILTFAQSNKALLSEIHEIKFYGVDYSLAKIFGAAETTEQFKSAFNGINNLFITEPKKYDVGKMVNKQVTEISLDAVKEVNGKVNDLFTTNKSYSLTEQQIDQAIRTLPIAKEQGTGLVVIAELLDKAENRGHYQVVFFNIETKSVIASWPANGKAKGFGLRNYWAASVYKALK